MQHEYGFTTFVGNIFDSIEYASKNNLTNIEINFSKQRSPVSELVNGQIKKVTKLAGDAGISISFHIPFTENISDNIPFVRWKSIKRLVSFIEVAGKLGANSITIHPGIFYWFPYANVKRTKALKRLVVALEKVLESCKLHNVIIALENLVPIPEGNEFYFLGDNIDDFKFIFDEIDSEYLGFCLDTGHANMAEGADKYIEELGEKLSTIHYHDNLGTNDNHLIIGEGSINWPLICERLNEINYKGPLISECRNIKPHEAARLFENQFNKVMTATKLPR